MTVARSAALEPADSGESPAPFYALLSVVYVALIILAVFISPGLFGFHSYAGIGSSMGDTIPSGSLVITRSIASDQIEVGDVIVFRVAGRENTISHRVIGIRDQNGERTFSTQGDGNRRPDSFLVSGSQQIEAVIFTQARLGVALPYAKALLLMTAVGGLYFLWARRRRARLIREGRARLFAARQAQGAFAAADQR